MVYWLYEDNHDIARRSADRGENRSCSPTSQVERLGAGVDPNRFGEPTVSLGKHFQGNGSPARPNMAGGLAAIGRGF